MIPLDEMKQKAFNNNVSQIKIEIVPSHRDSYSEDLKGYRIDKEMLDEFINTVDESAKTILKLHAIDIFGKVYNI